jgi:hypothetical protein
MVVSTHMLVGSGGNTALTHAAVMWQGRHVVGDCYSDVNCKCFVLQGAEAADGRLVLPKHREPLLEERQSPRE